jgi:hypothetical protein
MKTGSTNPTRDISTSPTLGVSTWPARSTHRPDGRKPAASGPANTASHFESYGGIFPPRRARRTLRRVANHTIKYRITWSERGERADQPPEIVEALTYRLQGEFFTFYSANPDVRPPILVVRTTDVREIRRVDDDAEE